ncbi:MAG: SGNH/GDSL hydrolase family protein [Verrucomicrobiota bacterium]
MKSLPLLLATLVALPTLTLAQTPKAEKGSIAEKKVADLRITPNPALPNVLLLGDSISIGYHSAVSEGLAGKANVFRPWNTKNGAAENCSDTSNGVAKLEAWLALNPKWDVIHFNWGLHDIKHVKAGTSEVSSNPEDPSLRTLAEYQANLEAIIPKLKATGAKLIFCTTTPVAPETKGPFRRDEDVVTYNAAAIKIMEAHSIAINDLYSFAKPQLDKIQLPVNVHYSPEGSKVLGAEVVKKVSALLPPQ